jgi:hypothetical protein
VPTAHDINERRIPAGEIDDIAVARVARVVEEGIVPAALLTHELEQRIRKLGQCTLADQERQRPRLACRNKIRTGSVEYREIESLHVPELP